MLLKTCKKFLCGFAALVFFSGLGWADHHQDLNGNWRLAPTRSEFAGEPVVQTGTLTINDRQGNIYIARNVAFEGENGTVSYSFSTDGRENSSIRQGKTFKSKAKWEGDVLKVTTTTDDMTSLERYKLSGDGSLMLTVDRAGHKTVTLFFERQ